MTGRVLLILAGCAIYWVLTEFGVPRGVAILIAMAGFYWADRKGLIAGPIQQSGRDLMFQKDEPAPPGDGTETIQR